MILTKADVDKHGLNDELIGSSIVFRYHKTGGVLLCPKCGKYLGQPKHASNGVIIESPTSKKIDGKIVDLTKKCPCCGTKAVLKGAEIVTKPGSITRIILRNALHGTIKAKVVLNREDKFDKKVAREIAFDKLMKKALKFEPTGIGTGA